MSETPQDPQPLQQTVERKLYRAPEFRDYGTVRELTQTAQTGGDVDSPGDGLPGYITGPIGPAG